LASGLILPQVSIEENYDEKDLLSECCLKAGLPSDSWLTLHDIDVYRFQAEIFRETGTNGKVVKFEPNVSKACETS
jgi:AMMECR1 domain-containing protein